MKAELNKALQENKRLKDLFNLGKMVEAMTKMVSLLICLLACQIRSLASVG